MTKKDFLFSLELGLKGLPKPDLEERLNFYSEMIDDAIEDGLSEEQAVDKIGSVDQVILAITKDYPLTKLVKNKIKPKRKLTPLELTLIIVGSPIWASLLISFFAVTFSVYVSLWAVIISLWAVVIFLCAVGIVGVFAGTIFIFSGQKSVGIACIGESFICLGLFIFAIFGIKLFSKMIIKLTKKTVLLIKKRLIKEAKQ